MILAELEIEDYKQFHGLHRFIPPAEGIIAVIGHNGAGKTTLFEAIEWCLFQPRSIAAAEVPTRGQSAKPRVKITLHDPETDIRYVVQRALRRGVASAFIYREDEPESQIVEGSRQVTEYVARQLIGLGHAAFVSTFFTRQKELSFFGALNETERRREVGRLLGMETIREAQKLINEDRQTAQREADGARAAWESETAGRDFGRELETAGVAVEVCQKSLAGAEAALAGAVAAHERGRQALTTLQAKERQDTDLGQAVARSAAAFDAASRRRDAARAELLRLDGEAIRRDGLVAIAASISALATDDATHEEQREAHRRRTRLVSQIERAQAGASSVAESVAKAVRESGVVRFAGWEFASTAAASMPVPLESLIGTAASIDSDGSQARSSALNRALELENVRIGLAEQHAKYQAAVESFQRRRAEQLAAGDPSSKLMEIERARTALVAGASQRDAEERAASAEITKLSPVADRLRKQQLGDICPTCRRPYTANDLEVMLPLLVRQIADANATLARIAVARTHADREMTALESTRDALLMRKAEIDKLETRIADGAEYIDGAARKLQDAAAELRRHLADSSLAALPTAADATAAANQAEQHRRIAGTLPLLQSLLSTYEQHRGDRESAQSELNAISAVNYDLAEHQRVRDSLKAAQSAAAAIQEIERQLAMRSARERELADAEGDAATERVRRTTLEAERAELRFDPAALLAAASEERAALSGERAARDERAAAAAALESSVAARERLVADHLRITRLAEQSDVKTREAETLKMMYEEFNQFERFVALRLAPALAESTGDLLRAVTDGRYDSVEVTESYGIRVFDGPQESFPMEQFSGGERDVIALCARLALSRLIGGQAAHPPGFLVLDEVFGSLDRDRRQQVLETLGTLSTATDAFKQLFIISHVDDVRLSPVFNEVWRITESDDGVSVLENLNATGGFEE